MAAEEYQEGDRHSIALFAEVKHVGQTAPLTVSSPSPLVNGSLAAIARRFAEEHQRTLGYVSPGEPLQPL